MQSTPDPLTLQILIQPLQLLASSRPQLFLALQFINLVACLALLRGARRQQGLLAALMRLIGGLGLVYTPTVTVLLWRQP